MGSGLQSRFMGLKSHPLIGNIDPMESEGSASAGSGVIKGNALHSQ